MAEIKKIKKMYFVKHEVIACSAEEALKRAKGHIYEVVLADKIYWPETKSKVGFSKKKL